MDSTKYWIQIRSNNPRFGAQHLLKIKRFEAKIPEDSSSRRIQISILVTILLKADIPEF